MRGRLIAVFCMAVFFLLLLTFGFLDVATGQADRLSPYWAEQTLYANDFVEGLPEKAAPSAEQQNNPQAVGDSDSDGLTDVQEAALGTDPLNVDSDCDYVDDLTEIGSVATPTDADSDGIIDALESDKSDSDLDGIKDESDVSSGAQLSCWRFNPFVIRNNGTEATRFEVTVQGGSVSSVELKSWSYTSTVPIWLDGVQLTPNSYIQLYNDGTHGDRVTGDKIWTRNNFTTSAAVTAGINKSWWFLYLRINGGADISLETLTNSGFGDVYFFYINAADVLVPTAMGPSVQYTPRVANIVNPKASLYAKTDKMLDTAKLFYNYFTDDYDFLMAFTEGVSVLGYYGKSWGVKNDVQFIGSSIYNNAASYGSAGKLSRAIIMNTSGMGGPMIHEIMHRWAAYGLSSLGFHKCSGSGHWGVAGVGKGQLGGFDSATLVDNGNGTYTVDSFGQVANGGDGAYMAPIEKYLAGFVDASSVGTMKIPQSVTCGTLDNSVPGKITFTASGMSDVTIGQVQTALGGSRVPAYPAAQKSFRLATVIVSQFPLTASEMTFYEVQARNLGAESGISGVLSFRQASGNTATMDTTLLIPQHSFLPMILR